ncbi:transcriptional regulator with XRE-family HTH domain [Aequitasia blattaphilus]|uniref:Helix-turn-helix domain-containing protein n=1 Tax=Aequitasia blattaphilus TaxID=2949332 RepID=A0ABT1E7C8_9FIRM|nr:helix-turn-helix transcriptional regulator [Aequitasia blattaphilus]MCP1101731.1 helix-turn-helix domain-containing protein [Aequitasia blattaphilus]MCR8614371.1 helix-turn-helix domain-containing protein [Aequitasia blattaphilus]
MELSEKIQLLRKQKGWTQEELAEALFVSRTAVSKWESGRGLPSIESLKAIAKLFAVSIDELLSGEEIISLAESEQKEKTGAMGNLFFGLLDCITVLLIFLPFFGQQEGERVRMVSLFTLQDTKDYVQIIYCIAIVITVLFGIVELALQNIKNRIWEKYRGIISLALNTFLLLFSIVARHPYPGSFLLSLLIIKGILLIKWQ